MKCPNCGNTEDFQKTNDGVHVYKMLQSTPGKHYCLKCGFKFSGVIEKRYGGKK